MSIIVTRDNQNTRKVDSTAFPSEDDLQRYIYDNPEAIPLFEIDEDVNALVLAREFQTSSGPIDALAVDKAGSIYIIETKLYKNPDKRTVIAQALDYGAALWKSSYSFEGLSMTPFLRQ